MEKKRYFWFVTVVAILDAVLRLGIIYSLAYIAIEQSKWWVVLFGFVPALFYSHNYAAMVEDEDEEES